MACDIEYTEEFETWWNDLKAREQDDITFVVGLLEEWDTRLGLPY